MYHLTVYDNEGKKLLDQPLTARDENGAKAEGHQRLQEREYSTYPYRIIHSSGRLVEFLSHKAKSAKNVSS
ncbi:YhzD family protein [Desmospora activa]|uniref:YhzD-like protein n=1 Tax=Desmospora activa DSM 45169 TaxID=1121389 RepID=A0A2T4Z7E7_9BACL|nr:YhzD family protein [Desmospora activa]PTM57818.1 YhzD-like protein [Desmospora activa DSM 45169]